MKTTYRLLNRLSLIGIVCTAIALSMHFVEQAHAAGGEHIVVIVNAANPVDNLSLSDLKKLWLSDKSHWDSGKAVAPVMLAAGAPERAAFLKIVCGMNDADFSKYFLQAAFTGKSATPPKEVGGAASVKSTVGSSPGAIGFVKVSEYSPSDASIKAVKVDGVAADDPAYKLKM
jgi:ABC-type phosphate transport system substrate-binding protein